MSAAALSRPGGASYMGQAARGAAPAARDGGSGVTTRKRSGERAALIPIARDDLCLDYANTLTWRGRATPNEKLASLSDLLDWLEGAAGLDAKAIGAARAWSRAEPARADALLAEAKTLREALCRIFGALAADRPVADRDLAALNRALAAAPARQRLARRDGAYVWATAPLAPTAPALLAPVLWSAADLLARADRRVRVCANPECQWLFLDRSKGGTRRWCDMRACGNRAKARRHYLRRTGR